MPATNLLPHLLPPNDFINLFCKVITGIAGKQLGSPVFWQSVFWQLVISAISILAISISAIALLAISILAIALSAISIWAIGHSAISILAINEVWQWLIVIASKIDG